MSKTRRKLRKLDDDMLEQIRTAIAQGADMLQKEARYRVPVSSGLLQSSIKVKKNRDGLSARVGIFGRDMKKAFYARWVEYGTKKMTAKPYLAPAKVATKAAWGRIIRQAVWRALRGYRSDTEYQSAGTGTRILRSVQAELND